MNGRNVHQQTGGKQWVSNADKSAGPAHVWVLFVLLPLQTAPFINSPTEHSYKSMLANEVAVSVELANGVAVAWRGVAGEAAVGVARSGSAKARRGEGPRLKFP